MTLSAHIYCLDANVIIQAWQNYYSPKLCPDYWDILNELGNKGIIFIPEEVSNEIVHREENEDDLSKWLRKSSIPVHRTDEMVISCWKKILHVNPLHKLLVDNIKNRSLADPWVISHAMKMRATVVTKENKVTSLNAKTVKIPNVCENMGIRCINDFDFLQELDMKFSCRLN